MAHPTTDLKITLDSIEMGISDSDENTIVFSNPPFETIAGLLSNTQNGSPSYSKENLSISINLSESCRSNRCRSAGVQSPTVSTIEKSDVVSVLEKFSKYNRKPVVKSRFNNIFLDQSVLGPNPGQKTIFTDLICQIDKHWHFVSDSINMDSKNSAFYERLAMLKQPKEVEKETLTENKILIKHETNEEESKKQVINNSPFFDVNKDRRCPRFLKGKPCSSQCSYIHIYPKDDGVLCKYYYLYMKCPIDCQNLHDRQCSKETKKRYQDKKNSERCLLYLYKDCKDKSCQKLHRLPKEDNIYCLNQLSLECARESNCIYKHRNDLQCTVSDPSNTTIENFQCSSNVKDVDVEKFITMDENFENRPYSSSDDDDDDGDDGNDKSISDTDSDNCAPEYYFPDSDPEDHFPKYGGVGCLINVFKSSIRPLFGANFSENKQTEFSNRENSCSGSRSDSEKYESLYSNKSPAEAYGDTVRYETSSSNSKKYEESLKSSKYDTRAFDDTVKLSHGDKNYVKIKRENNLFDLDSNELLKDYLCDRIKKEDFSKYPDDECEVTSSREETSSKKLPEKNLPDIQCINVKKEIPVYELSSDDDDEACKKPRLNENLLHCVKREMETDGITYPNSKILKLETFDPTIHGLEGDLNTFGKRPVQSDELISMPFDQNYIKKEANPILLE